MSVQIPLTQGQVAIVDDEDAELVLAQGKWGASRNRKSFYARRNAARPEGGQRTLYLHAFLTGYAITDHINGNGLDNRRSNLRDATATQNAANRGLDRNNTSGYKGVYWHIRDRKWVAHMEAERATIWLGYHPTAEAAARAYDAAALECFGEFAWLNFP